jgi:thiol-disulfide isomerase/thioredoxin
MAKLYLVTLFCILLATGFALAQDAGPTDPPEGEHPEWEEWAFELDHTGQPGALAFEDIAAAGEPFVLFFWLTDCPLCHLQLPYVQQLENSINEYELGLRVVTINLDGREVDVPAILEEYKTTFTCLRDPRGRRTDDAYRLAELGTPLTYLFDEDGLMVEYVTGFKRGYTQYVLDTFGIELPDEDTTG